MTKYIYARVSTQEQHIDQQIEHLANNHKHDIVMSEKVSGKSLDRPVFTELVNKLASGDTLIVKEVSRLGRRTSEVTSLIDDLKSRRIHLIIDNLGGVDVTSPAGKMIVDVMASLAEMERETMLERQRIGIERAKSEGKFKGKQQSPKTIKACQSAIKDIENGLSKEKAAKANGVGIATLYRFIKAS